MNHNQLVGTICEFLEVMIHYILYARNVYPKELFEIRRKYNTYVYQSRHPQLNEYIKSVVDATSPHINNGILKNIQIIIMDSLSNPLEKHRIQLDDFVQDKQIQTEMTLYEIYEKFRLLILKLSVMDASLEEFSNDCTFTVLMELKDGVLPTQPDNFPTPWIGTEEYDLSRSSLTPLKSIDMGLVKLQYIIEK